MRLVDADKLSRKSCAFGVRKNCESCGEIKTIPNIPCNEIRLDFLRMIDNAPTVKAIPIDKPFLKLRYGDYVVYNKKWLVDHLQTEWNLLLGKEYQPSIPIEWIERKLAEHWYVDYDIRELLEDWEKENE